MLQIANQVALIADTVDIELTLMEPNGDHISASLTQVDETPVQAQVAVLHPSPHPLSFFSCCCTLCHVLYHSFDILQ